MAHYAKFKNSLHNLIIDYKVFYWWYLFKRVFVLFFFCINIFTETVIIFSYVGNQPFATMTDLRFQEHDSEQQKKRQFRCNRSKLFNSLHRNLTGFDREIGYTKWAEKLNPIQKKSFCNSWKSKKLNTRDNQEDEFYAFRFILTVVSNSLKHLFWSVIVDFIEEKKGEFYQR